MSRRSIGLLGLGLLLLAGGAVCWWRDQTGWRAAVPAEQPVMSSVLAARVETLVARLWWEGDAATAGELAMLYHANGYLEEAEQGYRVLMVREQEEPRWPYLAGELAGTAGRMEEAAADLTRVLAIDPTHGLARRKRADFLFKAGNASAATAEYFRVLAQDPDDPYARLGLARLAVADARWLEARRELETLVGTHPRFAGGLSLLATVEETLGETRRAAELRRRAESGRFRAERDPWLEALLAYCLTSYRLRVAAAATDDEAWSRQLLERAVKLEPTVVANWQQLGRARQRAGDRDGAEAAFIRGLEIEPTNAQVWIDRIGLERERRDLPAVLAMAEIGWEHCPDDAGLNYEWGRALVEAERWTEAVVPLQRAVALDPYNPTATLELVALRFRLGEDGEAKLELEAGLARDPDHPALLEFLVRYHVRAGEEAAARAALERLSEAPQRTTPLENARREFAARFGRAPF